MFYGETVQETRQLFFSSWSKYQQKIALLPLEHEIVQVLLAHPEYHSFLNNPGKYHEHTYYPEFGETNPFLHMGLHLAVREQVATDRPTGISSVYQQLLLKYSDALEVEHLIMEQLAECLWNSQRDNLPPDDQVYLRALLDLCNK